MRQSLEFTLVSSLFERKRAAGAGLAVLLCLTLALTACGRRGPLEPPPASTVVTTDEQGNVIEETQGPQDRPFILDGLIQ